MWNANVETAKMVIPRGKNHAAGHSMTHLGHHRMLILFNVNRHPSNLQFLSIMAKRSIDTTWCTKMKLFTRTMKLALTSNLMKIHMKTGQMFLVSTKTIIHHTPKRTDSPWEVAFQQCLYNQGRMHYTSAVLSEPMVILAGIRRNTQSESGSIWRSRNVSK